MEVSMDEHEMYTMEMELGNRVIGDMLAENQGPDSKGVISFRTKLGFPYHLVGKAFSPNDAPYLVYKVGRIDDSGRVVAESIHSTKAYRKAKANASRLPATVIGG